MIDLNIIRKISKDFYELLIVSALTFFAIALNNNDTSIVYQIYIDKYYTFIALMVFSYKFIMVLDYFFLCNVAVKYKKHKLALIKNSLVYSLALGFAVSTPIAIYLIVNGIFIDGIQSFVLISVYTLFSMVIIGIKICVSKINLVWIIIIPIIYQMLLSFNVWLNFNLSFRSWRALILVFIFNLLLILFLTVWSINYEKYI